MIEFIPGATITTLGEAVKTSDQWTHYDYIEVCVDKEIRQIRSILVHDKVNAGLLGSGAADTVDLGIATYMDYALFRYAEELTELFLLSGLEESRHHMDFANTILRSPPSMRGFIAWSLALPVRALSYIWPVRSFGDVLLTLNGIILVPFLIPVVTPVTYYFRAKQYKQFKTDVVTFLEKASDSNAIAPFPDALLAYAKTLS